MHAKDVRKILHGFTKNKVRWYSLAVFMLPLYILAGIVDGAIRFLHDWQDDFLNPKELGYWHENVDGKS